MRLQELLNVYFYTDSDIDTMLHSVKLPTIPAVGHGVLLKGKKYVVDSVAWIERDGDFAVRVFLKHFK